MKQQLNLLFTLFFIYSVNAQFPAELLYQSIQTPNNVAIPNLGESVIGNSLPDAKNYWKVNDAFEFESTIEELDNYISGKN